MTRYTTSSVDDWQLVSHNGQHRVEASPRPHLADAELLRHDIRICSGRDEGYSGDVWSEIAISNLALSRAALKRLHDELGRWLQLPLAVMAEQRFELDIDVCSSRSGRVKVVFGERDDLVMSAGQTAVVFIACAALSRTEVKFVMTPTDLEGLAQGLATLLNP